MTALCPYCNRSVSWKYHIVRNKGNLPGNDCHYMHHQVRGWIATNWVPPPRLLEEILSKYHFKRCANPHCLQPFIHEGCLDNTTKFCHICVTTVVMHTSRCLHAATEPMECDDDNKNYHSDDNANSLSESEGDAVVDSINEKTVPKFPSSCGKNNDNEGIFPCDTTTTTTTTTTATTTSILITTNSLLILLSSCPVTSGEIEKA